MAITRRNRQQWEALAAEFEQSGEALARFCARRGLRLSTFRWWRSELRRAGPQRSNDDVRLIPVDVVGLAAHPVRAGVVELSVADVVVRVEVGVDVAYVASLVGELRRC